MLRTNPAFLSCMERLVAGKHGHHIAIQSFDPGMKLIRQEDHIHKVYVLLEGIIKCYMTEENDKNLIFEFLGKGEITGELEAIRKAPSICNVEAVTAVKAYTLSQELFTMLMHSDAELNRVLLEELATRLAQTCVRASYQQLYPIEYGLIRLLMLQEAQQVFFSKRDMADYLAITIRSFNRAVKQLRERKVLTAEGFQLGISEKELEELLRRFKLDD